MKALPESPLKWGLLKERNRNEPGTAKVKSLSLSLSHQMVSKPFRYDQILILWILGTHDV